LVLTPYIIRGPQDFQAIFERKMRERKEFVDRFHGVAFEYEADIDWTRKRGPVASYRQGIRREMIKAENEGPGTADQTIVKPGEVTNGGGTIGPVETLPSGDGTPTPIEPPPEGETVPIEPEPQPDNPEL
jgi:general secretion pathway protein D